MAAVVLQGNDADSTWMAHDLALEREAVRADERAGDYLKETSVEPVTLAEVTE
jgi:hypothetical protein